ncbi:MAG: hypothetical protein ACKVUT_03650 [Gaiella sp.]
MSGTDQQPPVEAEPARPVDPPQGPSRSDRARAVGYRNRFGTIYLALALVAGAALGAAVVLGLQPAKDPDRPWSADAPDGSPEARLFQIKETIPKRFRDETGSQLVSVDLLAPSVRVSLSETQIESIPVDRIIYEDQGDQFTVPVGASLQFTLCGNGPGCTLPGEPSRARFELIKREAVELALHTLKYVEAEAVVVLLPPAVDLKTQEPALRALFLRRRHVTEELSQPLEELLSRPVNGSTRVTAADRRALDRIWLPNLYQYAADRAPQDGALVMRLQPAISGS